MNYGSDSVMSALPLREEAEYAPHLERDYCSNFMCCGVPLADLHELVSHFEESHVTVISSSGMPMPPMGPDSPADLSSPQTASSSSSLESPRSTFANTPPPPNLFPTLTSAFQPRESAFPPVTTQPSRDPWINEDAYSQGGQQYLPKEEQYVFDSMMHSEAYDCNASTGIQVPMNSFPQSQHSVPPAHLSATPHNPPSIAPQFTTIYNHQAAHNPAYTHPPTIAPTPVYARPPTLSIITGQHDQLTPVKRRRTETRSCVSASESEELVPARRRKVQKQPLREKAFKCPREGCIKSYMNQNGLKYHLTKGVCDYDTNRAN